MKALLIAEKPSVAKNIKAVYEKMGYKDEIIFTSAVGHLLTLAYPEEYGIKEWERWNLKSLPIIPENFKYTPIKSSAQYLNNIKNELKNNKYDYIINACDSGREGELIYTLIHEYLNCKIPVKRLWINEYTDKGIKEGLNNLREDSEFEYLKLAAKYRQWFDWLLGMNLTRVITLKTNEKISVGRVMTPTLAILADRELEIKNFKSSPYCEIEASFKEGYKATWFNKDTKETKIISKENAEKLLSRLNESNKGSIVDIKVNENISYPMSLHDLGELQKEANQSYGYSLSKTLSIAQSLYEKHKLITYPRTDSKYLNKNICDDFLGILNTLTKIEEVNSYVIEIINSKDSISKASKNKKYVDDSKVTDHHAIIPTQQKIDISKLSLEEKNIYMLVVKKFLSIFMKPYRTNTTNITININGELFKAESKMLIDSGYKIMYPKSDKEVFLPKLNINDTINLNAVNLNEKQTKAPSRYNDATILSAMENCGKFVEDKELKKVLKDVTGIGTPATRAGIIDKLIKLELVEKDKKSFITTNLGLKIIDSLSGQDIISPALTATWEYKLKQLEQGEYDKNILYKEIIEYTKKSTNDFMTIETLKKEEFKKEETAIGKCPKCGGSILNGKKYFRCENYKNTCDFIFGKVIMGASITSKDAEKILAGEKTKVKNLKFKNGKTGKSAFILNPQTKTVVPEFTLNPSINNQNIIIGKCPICKNNVIMTKNYFMCEEYKKSCNFIFGKKYNEIELDENNAKKLLEEEECILQSKENNKKIKLHISNGKISYEKE